MKIKLIILLFTLSANHLFGIVDDDFCCIEKVYSENKEYCLTYKPRGCNHERCFTYEEQELLQNAIKKDSLVGDFRDVDKQLLIVSRRTKDGLYEEIIQFEIEENIYLTENHSTSFFITNDAKHIVVTHELLMASYESSFLVYKVENTELKLSKVAPPFYQYSFSLLELIGLLPIEREILSEDYRDKYGDSKIGNSSSPFKLNCEINDKGFKIKIKYYSCIKKRYVKEKIRFSFDILFQNKKKKY